MTLQNAQNDVVFSVISDGSLPGWQRLLIDVELIEYDDGYDLESVCIAILRHSDNTFEQKQFSLTKSTRDAIVNLYKFHKENNFQKIGGFELQLDYPGKYVFTYNYDKPNRLNGVWDEAHQSRLNNYLEHYKAEIKR